MKLGHESTRQFLEIKRNEAVQDAQSPYNLAQAEDVAQLIDSNGVVVRWPLEAMSDWFRDRLVRDLIDQESLIRLVLEKKGLSFPNHFAEAISGESGLSRARVDDIVSESGDNRLSDFIGKYADFVYYLSGARATESEGVLPQENLIDVSFSDLVGSKVSLSEQEIFFKVFIDTVKAKTSTIFPSDFLDSISIEDALDLRSVASSDEFVRQYNVLQVRTKESIQIRDPDGFVLALQELEEFEIGLYKRFNVALDAELSSRLVESRQKSGLKVLQSLASIAIPGYGAGDYKDLLVSGLQWTGKYQAAERIDRKVAQGLNACEIALERLDLLESQALLDYLDQLKKKYTEKLY